VAHCGGSLCDAIIGAEAAVSGIALLTAESACAATIGAEAAVSGTGWPMEEDVRRWERCLELYGACWIGIMWPFEGRELGRKRGGEGASDGVRRHPPWFGARVVQNRTSFFPLKTPWVWNQYSVHTENNDNLHGMVVPNDLTQ